MAGNCSIGDWEITLPGQSSAASAGSRSLTVAPGTRGLAVHVVGVKGPPDISVREPNGQRLSTGSKPLVHGKDYVIVEDKGTNATDVLIVHPPAGKYVITALSASDPISKLETAPVLPPFSGHGTVSSATTSTFDSGACRGIKLSGVPNAVSVTAGVSGVRYDGARGRARTATLKAGKRSGGTSGKPLGGKLCH
jgi:hypothetical protein